MCSWWSIGNLYQEITNMFRPVGMCVYVNMFKHVCTSTVFVTRNYKSNNIIWKTTFSSRRLRYTWWDCIISHAVLGKFTHNKLKPFYPNFFFFTIYFFLKLFFFSTTFFFLQNFYFFSTFFLLKTVFFTTFFICKSFSYKTIFLAKLIFFYIVVPILGEPQCCGSPSIGVLQPVLVT